MTQSVTGSATIPAVGGSVTITNGHMAIRTGTIDGAIVLSPLQALQLAERLVDFAAKSRAPYEDGRQLDRTAANVEGARAVVAKNMKSEDAELKAAGYEPHGSRGWWRKGGGPSLGRDMALRNIQNEQDGGAS